MRLTMMTALLFTQAASIAVKQSEAVVTVPAEVGVLPGQETAICPCKDSSPQTGAVAVTPTQGEIEVNTQLPGSGDVEVPTPPQSETL